MSAPNHDSPVKVTHGAIGTLPASNYSMLIEKAKQTARRSTPDSDALASSDDELEHHTQGQAAQQYSKPARRTSWLNEIPANSQRKLSMGASGSFSPTSSHPATPADGGPWPNTASPGLGGPSWGHSSGHSGSSFPWGQAIWNDSRKEPPPRLTEVLTAPTSSINPASAALGEFYNSPTTNRPLGSELPFPFPIPLHPIPKNYRSQSYSVGQTDPESPHAQNIPPGPYLNSRGRYNGLQHRPSRPSMLGESGVEGATLGRVREDEGDGESGSGSEDSQHISLAQAREIEQLTRENALLRQAATSQMEAMRSRDRAMSSASASSNFSLQPGARRTSLHPIRDVVPEESSPIIDDSDDTTNEVDQFGSMKYNTARRASEFGTNLPQAFSGLASLENRRLEDVKKAQWQSSLDFDRTEEPPQSRRHSFADVPMRHMSISSADTRGVPASMNMNPNLAAQDNEAYGAGYNEGPLSPGDLRESTYSSKSRSSSISSGSTISPKKHQLATYKKLPPVQPLNTRNLAIQDFGRNPLAQDSILQLGRGSHEKGYSFSAQAPTFTPLSQAVVPLQLSSVSSSGESNSISQAEQALKLQYSNARTYAASYFSGMNSALLRDQSLQTMGAPQANPYQFQDTTDRFHVNSRLPTNAPFQLHNQSLYLVTFKCCRSDVFYIPDGTGLKVSPGDLVIVEADRGTDLGTVAHANVSWTRAQELKEEYAADHYKWLMLFSRQGRDGNPNAVNPNGGGSAVGGMGPPGQHGAQEASTDIKPKMIKRLAQNHEIQTLRDKEGNEAKAKRVCQQKVAEHRLNMEILDAEFQM